MGMARLPTELYRLVATQLRHEDLKALRLADRALSNVATAVLFEEVHISPNSSSFDRAHCIAAEKHLSQHVRSLVYHFGMLADVYAGFDSFKFEYFANRNVPQSMYDQYELNPEVLWNYSCWLEEIDAQRTFELRDEAEELDDLCRRLPRLEAISTILDEANIFGDQEDYIGKRTGMAAVEDDGQSRFPRLFAAAIDKKLRKVSARSIQWPDLRPICEGSDIEKGATRSCLDQLRYLELGIYRGSYDYGYDSDGEDKHLQNVELLGFVLRHSRQLDTLRLDFDELPLESEPNEALPISKTVFSHYWPRLKDLKLEAMGVHEDELCNFLFSHRATLTTLCVGDIELISREKEIPSILSVFLQLHDFLRLETCKITGYFTNRFNQSWYVNTENQQPGCLRDQLEDFLCGKSSQRWDLVTSRIGSHGSWQAYAHLESCLHMLKENYYTFEDESWQWSPELLSVEATPEGLSIPSPMSQTAHG